MHPILFIFRLTHNKQCNQHRRVMGKSIFIAGGNSGIGANLVERLSNSQHYLHLALRKTEAIGLVKAVKSMQYYDVFEKSEKQLDFPEALDGLVYCPGSITLKPFPMVNESDMLKDMEVNAFGAARMVQAALPALKKSQSTGGASIIFFSSVAAQTGLPFHTSIAMAKAAVEGFALSLASELAPLGIRVNVIAPSLTDTPLAEKLLNSDAKLKASANRHPLKRVGTASGVSGLIEYLLSDEAAFVTGQVFKVDGGLSSLL